MGAINNAFNQVAGTVAGAGLVIKHAKETDFSKINAAENSALAARNEARAAEAEANEANNKAEEEGGLKDQLFTAKAKRKRAEVAYDKAVKRKNALSKTKFKKFSDLEAASEAEYELKNKYQALIDIKERAKEQRIYANKATELAIQAKQKYQSRWGGK